MKCPVCGSQRLKVVDTISRNTSHVEKKSKAIKLQMEQNFNTIIRVRECLNKDCMERFMTKELLISQNSSI